MKDAPNNWTIKNLIRHINEGPTIRETGMPARPCGYPSLGSRIKLAWRVFTGRADPLTGED